MASGIEIPEIAGGNGSRFTLLDVPQNLGASQAQLGNESLDVTLFQEGLAQRLFEQARENAFQKLVTLEVRLLGKRGQGTEDLGDSERSSTRNSDENRFKELTSQWQADTAASSSITEKSMHPAYQQIIGMGKKALPYIFSELKSAPHHWFWALRAITGKDPVKPEHRGNLKAMSEDWLAWREETKLLPHE